MAGKICIILNDNGYSISPSVGALTASHQYEQLSKAFNIKYINVEDGHDVSELVRLLEYVKQSEQICLIRIKTIKGHGDSEAIQDPEKYHQITAEQVLKLNETFQTNFVSILNHEGENNKKVKVLTPGMKLAAGLNSFKHKEQIIDLGIAEATTITVAGALSVSGDTPVVHLYSTFLQRGTDQLIHDIGIQNIPVILVIDRTGLAGTDGPTHHGIYDLSILTSIQSCKIYSFSSYRCFESTLRFYINNMKDFVALRIFKGQEINWSLINKGKAITHVNSDGLVNNIIHKKGDGCLIFLTHGRAAQLVLNLELLLAGVGKSSSIMEIVQLKPLELNEELEFIKNHKLIVIIEETIENGSLGQKFKSLISCENNWPSLLHFFINDAYVGEDIVETQWENSGLNVDHILKQINQIFSTD
jgi:1-deoxy-D-xylulose-5-phosphate synthase